MMHLLLHDEDLDKSGTPTHFPSSPPSASQNTPHESRGSGTDIWNMAATYPIVQDLFPLQQLKEHDFDFVSMCDPSLDAHATVPSDNGAAESFHYTMGGFSESANNVLPASEKLSEGMYVSFTYLYTRWKDYDQIRDTNCHLEQRRLRCPTLLLQWM